MSKRILFVDDEPMVLQGLQRSLRPMRSEWEFEFATGGSEALDTMSKSPFDVVITDMRMPGMDGAQLLDLVKAKFPRTVRMILSGQSDRETILRSVGPTHQYLSKPCDLEELKQKLQRAFALRDLLDDPHLKEIICRLETLPSLPSLYIKVTDALRATDGSIVQIGNIIADDMGMSAKVLQLVNSAFFGLSSTVSSPQQAAAMIGIENLKALVLSVQVFSDFHSAAFKDMGFLWAHSMATATFAKAIARAQGSPRATVDDAFAGGLLHDIGRLIFASACGAEYAKVLRRVAAEPGLRLDNCEQEAFGCSHNGVGAYLLGLWGLADPIVEAVAWHHQPSKAAANGFSSVIAVHCADHFDNQMHLHPSSDEKSVIDEAWLTQVGLQDRLPCWANACQKLDAKE